MRTRSMRCGNPRETNKGKEKKKQQEPELFYCHDCRHGSAEGHQKWCTSCGKNYCSGCLDRKYVSFMEEHRDKAAWRCPHCMGACTSKKCLEGASARKKKGKQLDPTTSSPFKTLLLQNTMLLEQNKLLLNRTVTLVDEINKLQQKLKEMETCSSERNQISILQHQLAAANQKLKMADLSSSEIRTEYEDQIADLQDRLREVENQLLDGEKLRKKLHNTILELERQLAAKEASLPQESTSDKLQKYQSDVKKKNSRLKQDLKETKKRILSLRGKVCSEEEEEEEGEQEETRKLAEENQVLEKALLEKSIIRLDLLEKYLLKSKKKSGKAIDDDDSDTSEHFEVCIFAYGPTGSGKSYTMIGRPEPLQKGLIPNKPGSCRSRLEIQDADLLASGKERGKQQLKHNISHDAEDNTYVSDITIVDVCSIGQASSLFQKATNSSTGQQVQGVLNLMDLAGSERPGATGERLKETQAINKSLSTLGDVICALENKADHIPFRNSKLTFLLQPCLGGHSKTLMFVSVSPDPSSFCETSSSLQFALRVNSCEVGIRRRQDVGGSGDAAYHRQNNQPTSSYQQTPRPSMNTRYQQQQPTTFIPAQIPPVSASAAGLTSQLQTQHALRVFVPNPPPVTRNADLCQQALSLGPQDASVVDSLVLVDYFDDDMREVAHHSEIYCTCLSFCTLPPTSWRLLIPTSHEFTLREN
ncbi:kinesin-like protein KIN-14C [Tanacetum coccineum]